MKTKKPTKPARKSDVEHIFTITIEDAATKTKQVLKKVTSYILLHTTNEDGSMESAGKAGELGALAMSMPGMAMRLAKYICGELESKPSKYEDVPKNKKRK